MRTWLGVALILIAGGLAMSAPGRQAHAQTAARRGSTIALKPAAGQAGTQVQITGSNYVALCAGYILIDDQNTGTQFHCDGDTTFRVTITWPDGLDKGNHRVTANSFLGATSATFQQLAPVVTPAPTDSPAATATPAAGTAGGGNGANPTPPARPPSPQYFSNFPAVLALGGLCCSVLALGAGMTMLILMMRRRDLRSGQGVRAAYVPPPPPDVPPDPDNPWVWPNDPFGR